MISVPGRSGWLPKPPVIVTLVLLLAVIATGVLVNSRFGTSRNLSNVLEQSAALGFASLGQMLVVLAGGIDLSVGAVVTASAVAVAALCDTYPEWAVLIVIGTLLAGAMFGALNGVLVVATKVHPLIVTLGTSSVLNGGVLLYTMRPAGSIPVWLEEFAYGALFGIPIPALTMLTCFALVAFFLSGTKTGLSFYAVGGNVAAAAAAGISVSRITVMAYAASGFLAALAGVYYVSRTGTGDPRVGEALTLASITPVVVGGTILGGGVGSVLGTLLGVALMSVLANLLNYMNVSTFLQWVVQGLVVLVAVSIYVDRSKRL